MKNLSSDGFVMRLFPQVRRRPDALRTNRPLLLQNMLMPSGKRYTHVRLFIATLVPKQSNRPFVPKLLFVLIACQGWTNKLC